MEYNIEKAYTELVEAVNLVMNPCTSANQRAEAHKMLEAFKETSPLCAKCGFLLSAKGNHPTIRHFGLRLIDHYLKLHWNDIDCEEKLWIKDNVIQLIGTDAESATKEETYIKDALSRIVVEIIKREWPQQWPSLMEELHALCTMGDSQTELVLLVFLRLAEDIVQFQNIPEQRRKEIYKTLCSHLNELFAFFLKTVSENCNKYFSNKQSGILTKARMHCRVAQVALETLSVFVEWVPVNHITETSLIKHLCVLLEDEELRTHAAQCLLSILDRKGKFEDRKELMLLVFDENSIFMPASAVDVVNEQHYLFLKVLCQMLVALGVNLCGVMAQFPNLEVPKTFSKYLNSILLFSKHPSMVLSHQTQNLWMAIFRSPSISQSPTLHEIIPNLLLCEAEKLLKPNSPLEYDLESPTDCLKFDTEEDFEASFNRYRADVIDVIRFITKIQPKLSFSLGSSLLKSLIHGEGWTQVFGSSVSQLNASLLWDALVHYFDGTCVPLSKMIHTKDVEEMSKEGLELLQLLISFTSQDPVILSLALSCISSLFFFVTFSSEMQLPVLKKIFSNLTCFSIQEGNTFTKEMTSLRRHVSALLIKLCSCYPKLLLPSFDYMCQHVQKLAQTPEILSQFDKCNLLEALMLLSNELCNYEKQLEFLTQMISPIIAVWLSDNMKMAISTPENFLNFVGLNEEANIEQSLNKNTYELMLCIHVIRGCVKRCKWPSDSDIAKKGNFVHPLSDSLKKIFYRNPAAQCIVPSLHQIFLLVRTLNALHDPAIQAKIHPSFLRALDISETDKYNILGTAYIDNLQRPKTIIERMNTFIHSAYDSCLHILGGAVENLSIDFYTVPSLSKLIMEGLFTNIQYMSDSRLRLLIHILLYVFLRPFILQCPALAYDEIMTVLSEFCPFMLKRLSTRWEKFRLRYGTSEEQFTEWQEILDDELQRILTREYISFLGDLLHSKYTSNNSVEDAMDDDSKEYSNVPMKTISELGQKIMTSENVRTVVICTAFDAMHWLDTSTNIKSVLLCELIFKKLLEDNLVQHVQEANYLLQSILYGLQELGEHDANQGSMLSLAVSVYGNLRPKFPELRETLISSVACEPELVNALENTFFNTVEQCKRPNHEKRKKEVFRNAISKIIGKNIGQHHKRNIVIKNLCPLPFIPKKKSSIDAIDDETLGLCSLFSSNEGS